MTELTWLMVGGCARSGTTALGRALRESRNIGLFHEVSTNRFLETVNGLFDDERQHNALAIKTPRGEPIISRFAHLMPVAERDTAAIVQGIFEAVLHKRAPVVGSKEPNFFLRPPPVMPPGITAKTVLISRNPYNVVLSLAKMRQEIGHPETIAASAEIALGDWIRGWNYAVARFGDEDFFHILYEDLDGTENARIARELAAFLKIEPDFDLASVKSKQHADIMERYAKADLAHMPAQIGRLFAYDKWREQARNALKNRIFAGFPLDAGEEIDFGAEGNGWKYLTEGFYPPEQQGSWTCGKRSVVSFLPTQPMFGDLSCRIKVLRGMNYNAEPPVATIRVNGQDAGRQEFPVDAHNVSGRWFTVGLKDVGPKSGAMIVEICVENPRSPKSLGLNEDPRSLGVFIEKLTLD